MVTVEVVHLRLQIFVTGAAAICEKIKDKKMYEDEVYRRVSLYEINKVLDSDGVTDLEKLVPREYHDFLPLFQEVIADKLPLYRSYYYKIQLKEQFEPLFGLLNSLSRPKFEILKKLLQENLAKGFIKESFALCEALILFFIRKMNVCVSA